VYTDTAFSPFAIIFIVVGVLALIWTAIILNRRKGLGLDAGGGQGVQQFLGFFCCGFLWVIIYCCLESQERSRQIANAGAGQYVVVPGPDVAVSGQQYQQMPNQGYPGQGQPATIIYQQPPPQTVYVAPPQPNYTVYYQQGHHQPHHHQHHGHQQHHGHHGHKEGHASETTPVSGGVAFGHGTH
jgi:hypothetical protein